MIGLTGTSVTISLNYNYYNVIADLHTFRSRTRTGISTSRLPATDLNTETSTSNLLVFNHFVLLCHNLYSTNLHNSLRTCSILVLVFSTAL
jgi:hypothetical protein